MLEKNILIEWLPLLDAKAEDTNTIENTKLKVDRVLYIGPDQVVLFDIDNKNALPRWMLKVDIEAAFDNGNARVLEVDPFDGLRQPEENIKYKHRQRRDKIWELFRPLVETEDGRPSIA